jgi:hypothetical protein
MTHKKEPVFNSSEAINLAGKISFVHCTISAAESL